jgi:glyoxylase-like metal-dependent hydrolase (beta-lactamase superfamily II)
MGDQSLIEQGASEKLCPTSLMAKLRVNADESVRFVPPSVDDWIAEETDLKNLLGIDGALIPVPSHTKGSLAVVVGSHAFVGDLFRGAMIGGTPELHFYMCDQDSNKRAIDDFLNRKAASAQRFFPGHFGPSFSRSEVQAAFDLIE